MKIYHAGTIGAHGYGWATCNNALAAEFERQGVLGGPESEVHFIPISDHDLTPSAPLAGAINIGYTFFEYPLGLKAAENAASYDLIFAGSTWCKDRLAERGITNVEVLIQGVDDSIFKPGERKRDGQFRIFSGGKFEYRKGQDLAIAAFREFAKTHPEAHLVCAWYNPWPGLIFDAIDKAGMQWLPLHMDTIILPDFWGVSFSMLLQCSGLQPHQFTILPQLNQQDLAREMQNTDCGLFPNRCEGGTNLVLMEYIACGGKAVANPFTGHWDICQYIDSLIIGGVNPETKWAEQSQAEIVTALEREYSWDRQRTSTYCDQWTWESAANQVIGAAQRLIAKLDLAKP